MIRPLRPEDAEAYTALRREMLVDSPWAFGSSPGYDRMGTVEAVRTWIETAEGAILGGFEAPESRLIASAGVMREASPKRRHIASIWGVYVAPAFRNRGVGRAVVAAAIEKARTWPEVEVVQLSASAASEAARRMYEKLGFTPWGREPDCLRVNGRSHDEIHMSMRVRT